MADNSSNPSGVAGRALEVDQPSNIRNVVLVGHTGAGKTTVVEALLLATGTINRAGRVEDGGTVSDFDEAEIRQQRSVNLSLAPIEHGGIKVNLLDAPGYADFVGDLRAGLRAADAALFVVSAADGVDGTTTMLWDECAAVGRAARRRHHQAGPPARRLRRDRRACARRVRRGRAARLPARCATREGMPTGLVGLLSRKVYDYTGGIPGGARRPRAPSSSGSPSRATPSSRGSSPRARTRP